MKRRAEESLTEEQMDFESQIEEYHRSLIIYTYRQNLLQQQGRQPGESPGCDQVCASVPVPAPGQPRQGGLVLARFARLVVVVADGASPPVVVGNSLGGWLALLVGARPPSWRDGAAGTSTPKTTPIRGTIHEEKTHRRPGTGGR